MINEAGMSVEELEQQHKRRDFIELQRGALRKAQTDGEARGEARGIAKGKSNLLLRLLTRRFGVVSESVQQRMQAASAEAIEAWFDRAIDAQSLEEVFGETRH